MSTWTDHRYHALSDRFYAETVPEPVSAPRLLLLNEPLAAALGLDADWLSSPEGVATLAGNAVLPGTRPVALAYAGHQFGQFVPVLGDGRAILLGEARRPDGRPVEIQLKGSGRTPFSRRGDGRAALGPVLREFLVSEAMAAFGIPTTRALAVVATGDPVFRETVLPGAVLVRVAESHVRVGTFQYFAVRGDRAALALLVDDVVRRSYPDLADRPAEERPLALLAAVAERQARLVAAWMAVGFIHGVMNTDNVALSGETLDYGPCAFLDAYHPATVFSSIDEGGRYAYGNQPRMAGFAMARLAETLLPLAPDPEAALAAAQGVIDRMADIARAARAEAMARKIGLAGEEPGADELVGRLLGMMAAAGADYTATFRALTDAPAGATPGIALPGIDADGAEGWLADWRRALDERPGGPSGAREAMARVNPIFIPRNHRIEAAIEEAVGVGTLGRAEALLDVLRSPFTPDPAHAALADPPGPEERVTRTFCGT